MSLTTRQRTRSSRKILVIEDTQSWSQLLKYSLSQQLQEEVMTANSMAEAVALIGEHQFDAAIADLCLPDAANGEIITYTLERKIPTWVLTGSFDQNIKNMFMNKAIVDYVVKNGTFCLDYIGESIARYWANARRGALIVDDTLSYRQLYQYMLETQNLKVFTANNGVEAMSVLSEHADDISIVLTDYQMPDMDGIEFCRQARQKYHKDKLSIIAISSSTEAVAANFLKTGANDFISKPFSREELMCRINQNLDTVENIRRIKELIDTDFLTGIFNRRHCFSHGIKTWNKWIEQSHLATAVMLDIDFFKKINDVYGHDSGDMVIKTLASKLNDYAKANSGFAYRFGGEEFALLLPVPTEHILATLEILRAEIEAQVLHDGDKTIKFTISMGVFVSHSSQHSLDECLKIADENLYQSKKGGRNRITASDASQPAPAERSEH